MDINSIDINEIWNLFINILNSLFDCNIPDRNTKAKAHLPCITRDRIRMPKHVAKPIQKQNKLGLAVTGKGLGNYEDMPTKLQPKPTLTT